MGKPRPETAKTRLCRHLPPAGEKAVSLACQQVLRERFFAVQLSEFKEAVQLTAGTLVFIACEFIRKPLGVDSGLPDLFLSRVGYWGWNGAELKERGREGQCAGRCSTEQQTAEASGLYIIAWAPEHVAQLIVELDRKSGYGKQSTTRTGRRHGKENSQGSSRGDRSDSAARQA